MWEPKTNNETQQYILQLKYWRTCNITLVQQYCCSVYCFLRSMLCDFCCCTGTHMIYVDSPTFNTRELGVGQLVSYVRLQQRQQLAAVTWMVLLGAFRRLAHCLLYSKYQQLGPSIYAGKLYDIYLPPKKVNTAILLLYCWNNKEKTPQNMNGPLRDDISYIYKTTIRTKQEY